MTNLMRILESSQQVVASVISKKPVRVVYDQKTGVFADTEAGIIHLPPLPELSNKAVSILRGYIDHEVGHITDTSPDILRKCDSFALKNLINAMEDPRVDRITASKALGLARNLDWLMDYYFVEKDVISRINNMEQKDEIKSFIAICTRFNFVGSKVEVEADKKLKALPLKHYSKFFDLVKNDIEESRTAKSTEDLFKIAKDVVKKLDEYLDKENKENSEKDSKDKDGKDKEKNKNKNGKGKSNKNKDKKSKKDKNKSKNEEDEDKNESGEKDNDKDESNADGDSEKTDGKNSDADDDVSDGDADSEEEKESNGLEESKDGLNGEANATDEMDSSVINVQLEGAVSEDDDFSRDRMLRDAITDIVVKSRYDGRQPFLPYTDGDIEKEMFDSNKAEDFLEIRTDYPKGLDIYNSTVTTYKRYINVMRSKLLMDLLSRVKRWKNRMDKGVLDDRELYSVVLNNERIFRKRQKQFDIDTAVQLVVDCSGSMGDTKIENAMNLAIILSETLNLINIPFEVVGFTQYSGSYSYHPSSGEGYTRTYPLVHFIFKDFNMKLDRKCRIAIGNIKNVKMANNIDGESLRWAIRRLLERKEKRKVMIVLSDGIPSGWANYDVCDDLKKVTKAIDNSGEVELFGIGINSDHVEYYYKNYCVVHHVNEIVSVVYKRLSSFLREVKRKATGGVVI